MWALRISLLMVGAVVASVALGVSGAVAEESPPVEVMAEDGEHCEAVDFHVHEPSGGCELTAHTDQSTRMLLYNHAEEPGEEHLGLLCDSEFEASVGEDGHGYIYHQQLSGAGCGIAPCDEAAPSHENLPWEFQIREERGAEVLRMTFCVRLALDPEGTAGTPCTADLQVADVSDHEYTLAANEAPCINLGGAIELSGGWSVEGTDLEIEHRQEPPPSPVEVMVEDGGHCPAVVFQVHEPSGGCEFTLHTFPETPVILFNHVEEPGQEHIISICDHEYEATVGEDGHGYLYHQQLSGVNCGIEPCDEAAPSHESLPWEFQISEVMAGEENLRMTFCVRPPAEPEGTAGTPCTIDLHVVDVGVHEYVLSADESPCVNLGGAVEFSGSWFVEGTGLEIEHPIS